MLLQTTPSPEFDQLPELLGSLAIFLVIGLLVYIYFAITLMVIARKSNTPNGWLAWIPLANLFLMCQIARKSGGWVVLLIIPIINIFALAFIWMGIAEARGKSPWMGALILLPIVGLIVPAYLAAGPNTNPAGGVVTGPRQCRSCGVTAAPTETFCGNCGQPLPLAAAAATRPAQSSGGKGALIGVTAVLAVLALTGGIVWYAFFRELPYTPPSRQAPHLPQRAQGSIKEFPVDTDPTAPARPASVIAQEFDQPARGSAPIKPQVPQDWLPPGVQRDSLPQRTRGITSATYRAPRAATGTTPPARQSGRTSPATQDQDGAPIYVHVLTTPPGRTRAGDDLSTSVTQATGGNRTGVRVDSPTGGVYTGSRIKTPETVVYVLNKQGEDVVILIYTPDPAAQDVADRLAGNVGNGNGLNDYPEVQDSLWTLPARPPGDLTLAEVNSLTRADMERSLNEVEANSGTNRNAEVQQLFSQIRQFIPDRLTAARYVDRSQQDWSVVQCDFGSSRRAWNTWMLLRWTMGLGGMKSIPVLDGEGLYADEGRDRVLIFQRGPYLIFLTGPSAAPVDRLTALANQFQV